MKIRLVLAILLSVGLLSIPAFAKDMTVGEFALKYANSINLKMSNENDAVRALMEKGLLSRDLSSDLLLTEKILVDIFNRAGLNASTSNPDNVLNENAANSAISSLSSSFGSSSSAGSSTPQGGGASDDEIVNKGKKTRPKGQTPNSHANPNAFFSNREDEG